MSTSSVTTSLTQSTLTPTTSGDETSSTHPRAFSASIIADEVVAPGTDIELSFGSELDPRSVQGAIRVEHRCEQMPARVALGKRGRSVTVQLEDTVVGACSLVIAELLSAKGEKLVEYHRLPFAVVPISGKVPGELRVEHTVRVVIDDLQVVRLAPGQATRVGHIDLVKAVDRAKGTPVELAFNERGDRVEMDDLLAQLAKRRTEKFGRLHETLFHKIESSKDGERMPIIVWPRISLSAAPYEKPADHRSIEAPEGERKVTATLRKASEGLRAALQRAQIETPKEYQPDDAAPFVRATATVAQIRQLADNKAVGVIFFDDVTAINDLGDSIAVARSDRAHLAGFDGTGIRVAVWEDGPSVTTNLSFADRFTSSPSASAHARLTSAVVKNVEPNKPHGHAPDCDLYSANTSGVDALRWAVRDQHCTVVSQSFHRGSEPGGSGLQSDDLLKDMLALRWPYPTIVQAAGNFWSTDPDGIMPPEDEFVNHKGFNSITVGNHDDTAGAMAGDSVFRNPPTTHGDRELPEIAANGTGVSANGQTMSGTSFSAPATAGVTALLQDVDGVLCSWPEGCRAILMASAGRNVRGSTWWQDLIGGVDGRDGAGAVDAQAGVRIAQQRRFRGAPATSRGWDVGTLSPSDFGNDRLATFRYHVAVPRLLFFPRVKVALAWDSAVTSSGDEATASRLTVDFDLLVRDSHGVQVASAASWDNSYEVVDFAAVAGETYDIVIRKWTGTDSVWFGVAWSATGFSFGSLVAYPLSSFGLSRALNP
ncbi:MAG TPA: S8 family serine peptidase [Gemmatimonadaceae bacterium]|nr:S8 family serine peptidase [Gemmatimonadaceae bacterium]